MNVIPWRFSPLSSKRFLWVIAGLNQGSPFVSDRPGNPPSGPLLGLSGQDHVLQEVSLVLDVPDGTRDRCRNLDGLHLFPAIKTRRAR